MNNYPNYPQWQALLLSQYSGELLLCVFITGLVLLWLLWRGLFKRWQVVITFAVVGVFYSSITFNNPQILLIWVMIVTLSLLMVLIAVWMTRLAEVNLIWIILFFALVARLPNLFTEPFWYDEATTAAFAQVPIQNLWALGGDTHPPLFYLPFWLVSHLFGSSEPELRLPSLAFGVLAVYLIYRLTLALGMKRETALVAALIIAVLPGALRYSNDARAYSQLACCVLGMAVAVLENRPRWFAFLASCTLLTQNIGYLYVATIGGVAFLWYVHQTTILSEQGLGSGHINYRNFGPFQFHLNVGDKRWWWALLIPAAVGVAWLPFMFRQLQSVSDGWWVVFAPGAIIRPLFELTVGVRVTESLLLQTLSAVFAITLLGILARFKWLLTTNGNLWFVLCFATPAIAAIISLWTPIYVNRAFLPSFLAIPIVWAYLITERRIYERVAAAGVLVPILAIALQSYFVPDRESRVDWRAQLSEGCQDAPVVFSTSLNMVMLARYYLPDAQVIAWSGANDINLFFPESIKQALGIEQMDSPPSGRVCLLDYDTWLSRGDERAYAQHLIDSYSTLHSLILNDETWSVASAAIVSVP